VSVILRGLNKGQKKEIYFWNKGMILRGLNKGQKKEIYFWNKAKIFSSFLLIVMHVLHHTK